MGDFRRDKREVFEMNIKLKEDKFHIRVFFAPCACHCRFCCLGDYPKDKIISFEDYAQVMKKYAAITDDYGMRLRSFIYNCPEHSYIKEQIQLYEALPMERAEYVQIDVNGTKMKSESEISSWLDMLQDAGVESVAFSWFGNESTHDCFVNRKGYFAYLNRCATEAKRRNIPVKCKVFLHRGIMDEVDSLIAHLEKFSTSIKGAFMEYSGNAKKIEKEFLTIDDFNSLSNAVKAIVNEEYRGKFKTECEWIKLAQNGKFPKFNIVDYVLYIDSSNINYVLNSKVDDVIANFREMNRKFQNSFGEIGELAAEFGDKDCLILYECRDILRKWLDKYYEKNFLDKTQLFSFTHSCVEWKVYERL